MAAILTISDTLVAGLARLDLGDADVQTDVDFALANAQEGIEGTIRSEYLTDAAVVPLLVLNVGKLLAAEVLALRRREDGAAASFQGAGLLLAADPDHAAALRREADAALLPYRVRVETGAAETPRYAVTPTAASPASRARQDRLFGRSEGDRHGDP